MYFKKCWNNKFKIGKILLICGLLLVVMVAGATGDVEPSSPIEIELAELNVTGVPAADGDSDESRIQSIIFKQDMRIRDALRFLSAKYHKNIVPSYGVDGTITVTSLYDVTFEEALDSILGYGFKYEEQDNFIHVYTADEYKRMKEDKERMTHKVFTLYYINAAEVSKLIDPLLSLNGKVEATSPAQTGVPTGESISSVTAGGDTMSLSDAILVYDYPENIAGIDWNTLQGSALTNVGAISRGDSDRYEFSGSSPVSVSGGLTVGIALDNVAAFMRAVEEVTDITVMANPKILAVNKQLGQVYIGTKLGYREGDIITDGGSTQEGAVKFLDTGTKLSFRPYIGNDGYIRMDIHPKDSSGSLNNQGVPDETSAELVTNIVVKDGQTIVIGGLFRDKVTSTESQIPLLGDLPLIGVLFRGTTDKTERQEVIVLLTPHIITEPDQVYGDSRAEDVERKRVAAKDGIQWASKTRLAHDSYATAARAYIEGDYKKAMRDVKTALRLRPTYLGALRLKERIIGETDPNAVTKIERNVLRKVEGHDTRKWLRR
ncbi:MAG: type II secretion system protein GspD [Planctomycetota bacterium]|jgi:type II secretory pathway component GspD/PulD (secretin)